MHYKRTINCWEGFGGRKGAKTGKRNYFLGASYPKNQEYPEANIDLCKLNAYKEREKGK
jgi:hypothetical protein